ncbi:MAG: creatininase family protein [Candidatus Hodarchaeota archaeon]
MTENIKLEEMTSPDIRTAIERGMDTIVFGVGSNEQHGPCLPVFTDAAVAEKLAYLVAQKLGNALKGPTITLGCSDHHMKFTGTISIRKETLQNVIKDYCASLTAHGFPVFLYCQPMEAISIPSKKLRMNSRRSIRMSR